MKTRFIKGLHPERVDWRKAAILVSVLWVIAQLVLIAWFWDWDTHQNSDWGGYIQGAYDFYRRGSWYPDRTSIHSAIWAPGLFNWFILQLNVFGSLKSNFFFNLAMNIGILYNVWYLTDRFFSRRTAYIAVILFCLVYSNVMIVLPAGTEVPFLFLCLTAFSFCVSGKAGLLPVAGCLLALGNWIRPLALIFLPSILLLMYLERRKAWHYAALLVPAVCVVLLIGNMAKRQCGYFAYQSTTSGINLIMGANDKAYGGVETYLFSDTASMLHVKDVGQLTFVQQDSILIARSIEWIEEHPVRFAWLFVPKLAILYMGDSWADRATIGGDNFVNRILTSGNAVWGEVAKKLFYMVCKSVTYYAVCLVFLVSLVRLRKMILTRKGLILLVWLAGTLATCLFAVIPRYHYPFMFAIIIWAAYGIDAFLSRRAEPAGIENRENA